MYARDTVLIFTANTRRSAIVGLMLGQRRRRWTNIRPTMASRSYTAPHDTVDLFDKTSRM